MMNAGSGTLTLFNPSSDNCFVKHFIATTQYYMDAQILQLHYCILDTAGYGNTTSAVNAIRFEMSSGNI